MNKPKSLAAVSLALLLLAACSSGIDDIYGGGSDSRPYEIRGVVDYVDTNSRSVYLRNVSGYTSMLSSGESSNVRVYFDDRTAVDYQGRSYRPEDLEPGDEVSVRVDESGNRLLADRVTVLRDVSGGTTPDYGSTVRGTVRYVDTTRRTIEIDRGGGSPLTVEYDANTPVYFNGQTYRPMDLERGDEIQVQVRDFGSGRLAAQQIDVLRSVSGNPSDRTSMIRGTVRYVDASRRTIELDSPSWISGFNSGSGSARTVTIQYDSSTSVDVQGRLHPVTNLERGDLVEVEVDDLGGSSYLARRVVLVRDVRQ